MHIIRARICIFAMALALATGCGKEEKKVTGAEVAQKVNNAQDAVQDFANQDPMRKDVTKAEVKEKVNAAVDASAKYLDQKKEEYLQAMDRELADLRLRYEEMKKRRAAAQTTPPQDRMDLERTVDLQLDTATKRFELVRKSEPSAWEGLKSDLRRACDDLKEGLDKLGDKMKDSSTETHSRTTILTPAPTPIIIENR